MCKYKIKTPNEDAFFCRNPKVNIKDNVVNQALCDLCTRSGEEIAEDKLREIPDFSIPNWKEKANNLASALKRKFKSPRPVPESVYQERLKVCLECKPYRTIEDGQFKGCKKCGCTSLKLRWSGESCPIDKWPAFEV